MKKGDNIEAYFKKTFDSYEVDPGDQLWSKIQREIPSSANASSLGQATSAASKAGSGWLTTAIVAGAIAVTSVAGYYYFEKKAESIRDTNKANKSTPSSIEESPVTLEKETPSNISEPEQPIKEKTVTEKVAIEKKVEADSPEISTKPANKSNKEKAKLNLSVAEKNSDNQTEPATSSNTESITSTNTDLTSQEQNTAAIESVEKSQNTNENKGNADGVGKGKDLDSQLDPSDLGTGVTPKEETPQRSDLKQFKPMNVFTPNGDGTNDFFLVNKSDIESLGIEALEVKIFNNSGKLINEWKGLYGSWNGTTMSGAQAPEGSYFYQMILTIEGIKHPKQGTVYLTQ